MAAVPNHENPLGNTFSFFVKMLPSEKNPLTTKLMFNKAHLCFAQRQAARVH
jgi:hypothetical protein